MLENREVQITKVKLCNVKHYIKAIPFGDLHFKIDDPYIIRRGYLGKLVFSDDDNYEILYLDSIEEANKLIDQIKDNYPYRWENYEIKEEITELEDDVGWHSIEDYGLPQESGKYLVTTKKNDISVSFFNRNDQRSINYWYNLILAFAVLPKPYEDLIKKY